MAIKQKTTVKMTLQGAGETHARMIVQARGVQGIIDEPEARGGTDLGLTPTETIMSALMGCTNVISSRIAHKMGITLEAMNISLSADFNRLGTMLEEELDQPFSNIVMDISVATDATPAQLAALQSDLSKFCPIAKVLRGSGVSITENWTTRPL